MAQRDNGAAICPSMRASDGRHLCNGCVISLGGTELEIGIAIGDLGRVSRHGLADVRRCSFSTELCIQEASYGYCLVGRAGSDSLRAQFVVVTQIPTS